MGSSVVVRGDGRKVISPQKRASNHLLHFALKTSENSNEKEQISQLKETPGTILR